MQGFERLDSYRHFRMRCVLVKVANRSGGNEPFANHRIEYLSVADPSWLLQCGMLSRVLYGFSETPRAVQTRDSAARPC
jgi:hypothetical protein